MGGGSTWVGTPLAGTPSRAGIPWDQVHPPGPGTSPQDQVHPPGTRYPTPWQVPLPQGRYTPRDQVHPPSSACWEIRATSGLVRILLECILVRNKMAGNNLNLLITLISFAYAWHSQPPGPIMSVTILPVPMLVNVSSYVPLCGTVKMPVMPL